MLCLFLKTLDCFTDLRGIVPGCSGTLLEDPFTKGTNALKQFGSGGDLREFASNRLPLISQGLDLPCDLCSPLEQSIRGRVCQIREGFLAFRREGLEQLIECSWWSWWRHG